MYMDNRADADDTESLWQQMTSMFEGRSSSGTPLKEDEAALIADDNKAQEEEDAEHLDLLRAQQDLSEVRRQEQEKGLLEGNMALSIVGRINALTTEYMHLEATLSELVQKNKELGDDWNYYTNDSQDEISGLKQRQDISLKMEAIRNQGMKIQAQMKDILIELESYGVQIPKSGGRRSKTRGRKSRKKRKTKRRK